MEERRISFGLTKWKTMVATRASYFEGKRHRVNNGNSPRKQSDVIGRELSEENHINSGSRMVSFSKAAGSRIYSGVKRLLHRVEKSRGVETIKHFLWGGYQKLPKPPSFPLFFACREPKVHQSFRDYHNFYSDANGYYVWSSDEDRELQTSGEERSSRCNPQNDEKISGSFLNFGNIRNGRLVNKEGAAIGRDRYSNSRKLKVKPRHELREEEPSSSSALAKSRAEACLKFEQKLREIVMDHQSNLEDVLDIEEFLHCYSRLNCPFYIDMVNQFFMDICGEFLR